MGEEFVTYRGLSKYYVKDGKLNLRSKGITDITMIYGLENLTDLEILKLGVNNIEEIKGLENLTNLKKIFLGQNRIRTDERDLVGIGQNDAQELVKYCQEKARMAKEGG